MNVHFLAAVLLLGSSFEGIQERPYEVLRADAAWCGPRVLYFFCWLKGKNPSLSDVVELCKTGADGLTTMYNLVEAAETLDLDPDPRKVTVDVLIREVGKGRPSIVCLSIGKSETQPGYCHFVGLLTIDKGACSIFDPSIGFDVRIIPISRLVDTFSGDAIFLGSRDPHWILSPMMLLAVCFCLGSLYLIVRLRSLGATK